MLKLGILGFSPMNSNQLSCIIFFSSHLSWVNSGSGQGFSLEYPHISIHAVSRDRRVYTDDCLYLMIDTDIDFAGMITSLNTMKVFSEWVIA